MSKQEDFGRSEKPLEKTREIDNEARILKKVEMKRKFNRNQKRLTLWDIQLSSLTSLITCSSSWAVHLKVTSGDNAISLSLALRCLIARKGLPKLTVNDKFETFKGFVYPWKSYFKFEFCHNFLSLDSIVSENVLCFKKL